MRQESFFSTLRTSADGRRSERLSSRYESSAHWNWLWSINNLIFFLLSLWIFSCCFSTQHVALIFRMHDVHVLGPPVRRIQAEVHNVSRLSFETKLVKLSLVCLGNGMVVIRCTERWNGNSVATVKFKKNSKSGILLPPKKKGSLKINKTHRNFVIVSRFAGSYPTEVLNNMMSPALTSKTLLALLNVPDSNCYPILVVFFFPMIVEVMLIVPALSQSESHPIKFWIILLIRSCSLRT